MELNEKIDMLLDIISEIVIKVEGEKTPQATTLWPIPTPQSLIYWQNEWSNKIHNVFKTIDSVGISNQKLKEALKFPSRPAQTLWRLDAIKHSNLNKEQKLFVVKNLFECVSLFRKNDLFCKNGNAIWNKEELEKNKKDLKFFSENEQKHIISTLKVSFWLYAELMYWTNHPLGHSFHGPYHDKDNIIIVREFFDLKPPFWSSSENLKFDKIEIFEVYKDIDLNKDFQFEFFERELVTKKSLNENLSSFAIKANSIPINSVQELQNIKTNLDEVIEKIIKENESLDLKGLIKQQANMWFYAIKPLCDLVGENWQPPNEVDNNIYKRFEELNQIWESIKKGFIEAASLPYEEKVKSVKLNSFDPRV
jgi:hypothetical protein